MVYVDYLHKTAQLIDVATVEIATKLQRIIRGIQI